MICYYNIVFCIDIKRGRGDWKRKHPRGISIIHVSPQFNARLNYCLQSTEVQTLGVNLEFRAD